jgi:hypothetical protein
MKCLLIEGFDRATTQKAGALKSADFAAGKLLKKIVGAQGVEPRTSCV